MSALEQALRDAMKTVETKGWPLYLRISQHGDVDVINTDGGASMRWASDTEEQVQARIEAVERLRRELHELWWERGR